MSSDDGYAGPSAPSAAHHEMARVAAQLDAESAATRSPSRSREYEAPRQPPTELLPPRPSALLAGFSGERSEHDPVSERDRAWRTAIAPTAALAPTQDAALGGGGGGGSEGGGGAGILCGAKKLMASPLATAAATVVIAAIVLLALNPPMVQEPPTAEGTRARSVKKVAVWAAVAGAVVAIVPFALRARN